jgi:hypothetical protein
MMELEPTTFCVAKGPSDLTAPDGTNGNGIVERNHREAVVHRRAVLGHQI